MPYDPLTDADFDTAEIFSRQEVRSAEQLDVPLPENNADFHTIALELSRGLPRRAGAPDRGRLSELVRAQQLAVEATEAGSGAAA